MRNVFIGAILLLLGCIGLYTFLYHADWYAANIPNDFIMGLLIIVVLLSATIGIILLCDQINKKH